MIKFCTLIIVLLTSYFVKSQIPELPFYTSDSNKEAIHTDIESNNEAIKCYCKSALSQTNGWTIQYSGTKQLLYAVHFLNKANGFIVGAQIILKTINSGENWINTKSQFDLTSVFMVDTNTSYAAGNPTVLKTIDNGINWKYFTPYLGNTNSIFFTDLYTGYAVGEEGYIMQTKDGGLNWNYYTTEIFHPMNCIFFINDSIGYAVGDDGIILKTTTKGESWNYQNTSEFYDLRSVFFIDDKTGYIAGFDYNECQSLVLKTTDGGTTWKNQNTGTLNWLNSVFFTLPEKGYIVGDRGTILNTIDGGKNWTIQNSGTSKWLSSVYFVDSNTGYIVGDSGLILTTNNGGVGIMNTSNTYDDIAVYTNQTYESFYIDFKNTPVIKGTQMLLFNMDGKLLMQKQLTKRITEIIIRDFPGGYYIVKIVNGKLLKNAKILKMQSRE